VSEAILINQVRERLSSEYPLLAANDVQAVVGRAYAKFETSPIRDFVPLFVERNARLALSKYVTEAAS
jgi:hypothetical protein